jgi:hypothetical protein
VSDALSAARREGAIPWDWMEDRLRRPRFVQMWSSPQEWADGLEDDYARDVWAEQPRQIELWLEKDALSGVFLEAVSEYRVTLNVGRGYDGWDSIHNAAVRFGDGSNTIVLYFGDFDPSGEDMVRSLRERLAELGSEPEIIKCALNPDDIQRYRLPPNLTKPSDSRAAAHKARFGDLSVELDALPVNVLAQRIRTEIERHMDMDAFEQVLDQERDERERIRELLEAV